MAVFNEPTKWAQTLGKDADVVKIPDIAGDTDPSIDKIFPSVFSIPLAQGGKAIPRSVLNGLFKLLGDWSFYQQNGGIASYSNTFDYAVGSFVKYNNQLYICIQANGASSTVKVPTDANYWLRVALNNELANYLPLAGGNVTGNLIVQDKNVVRSVNGVNADANGNVIYSDITESNKGVSYLKLSDGTLIQWGSGVAPNTEVNFSVPFLNEKNISMVGTVIGEAVPVVCNIHNYTKTYFRFNVFNSRTGEGTYKVLSFIAIGRWK